MSKLSLKRRSFIAAMLVLLVFIPLTALTLEKAFVNSLTQSIQEQLRIQNLGLISEFELVDGTIHMPFILFNDALNLPSSGTYAFIAIHRVPAWQSSSTVAWEEPPELSRPSAGNELFQSIEVNDESYFQFSFTAEFEDGDFVFPITFHILQNQQIFNDERDAFRATLWKWLGLMALILVVLLLFSLSTALRPISNLIQQIRAVEKGDKQRIDNYYPSELEKLKDSINHLIEVEEKQRQRYHNSLSDLAHSLKTPLAVLQGLTDLPADAQQPLTQINNQIQRQLKRAVGGKGSGWQKSIEVAPIAEQVINALSKVYQSRQLTIQLHKEYAGQFRGDKTDLMELLGNILDNACKAAQSKVEVKIQGSAKQLVLIIEDDGPGIAPEQRDMLMQRGKRLDTYAEGQGIGMAIVADLLEAYDASIEFLDNNTGTSIRLTFPL
ncbi:ATP-binding protein [Alteromonadaceae bacterium BrNp21-10]|nr:ATP-binding protein [Alteromonadaceae bacterium BrNp21-10]